MHCHLAETFDDLWLPDGSLNVGAIHERDPAGTLLQTPAGPVNLSRCAETGWEVTGVAPDLTVTPSLHVDGGRGYRWHGFLTEGELTP